MACTKAVHDVHDPQFVRRSCASFLDKVVQQFGVSRVGQLSSPILNKLKKDDLIDIVNNSLCYLNELVELTTDFRLTTKSMKNELIESQQSIIKLQSELLESKSEQLESLKVAVKSSVADSVKAEFKSYSSVVQSSCPQNNAISTVELQKVVENVVQQEDRSKNLMIFGLPENNEEQLDVTVGKLFEAISEKPKVEVCRVGLGKSNQRARPVKVTAACSAVIDQILFKSKKLKETEGFKSVFLSPDRSLEQRTQHRELVKDLKKKIVEEPGMRHYIKNSTIVSIVR